MKQLSSSHEHSRLGEEKISKLLLEFSIPATVGMLINSLYNIVDRVFIGREPEIAALGLTALAISFPIMMIMSGVAMLFGAGGGVLYSISLGRKDTEGAGKVLGNVVTLLILSSLLITALGLLFLEPLLLLFGTSPEVMPYAKDYMHIILFASLTQGLSMGCNHMMRADGSPNSSMVSMIIGAGFNTLFNYIFVFRFHMGIAGCAYATIGGQGLAALWGLSYFLFRSQTRLKLSNMLPDFKLTVKLMVTGLPVSCTHISSSLLNIVLNRQIGLYGGDVAVSSIGIITSLNQFIILPITGIHHGAQPIIGYNRGAGNYARIRETFLKSICAATTICLLAFLAIRFFPVFFMEIFGNNKAIIEFGSSAMQKWFLLLPLSGFQTITALYFQAQGRSNTSLFLTFSRQLLLLIPAIYILGNLYGLDGILYASPLAESVSFAIALCFFIAEMKKSPQS